MTGRYEPIRMLLSKQTGWPTFVQSHPSVKTQSDSKSIWHIISPPIGREKISDLPHRIAWIFGFRVAGYSNPR